MRVFVGCRDTIYENRIEKMILKVQEEYFFRDTPERPDLGPFLLNFPHQDSVYTENS